MDGGSLNTAYISISEYLERIRLMSPRPPTACFSGQLPLEESPRLLERRDPYLRYRDSGETPQREPDDQFTHLLQNEPENSNPTYPSCSMPVSVEAQIGIALRSLMDSNGFSSTKIIGYEHNWSDAANYPVQLVRDENALWLESVADRVCSRCSRQGTPSMGSLSTATRALLVNKHRSCLSTQARWDGSQITARSMLRFSLGSVLYGVFGHYRLRLVE